MRLLSLGRAPSPAVSSWRAVAAGNEVTNPFVVTEVYMREGDIWTLGSLSFTRLVAQLEENTP